MQTQILETNCKKCGKPTEWDYSLGLLPLCVECWDKTTDSFNPMAAAQRAYREQHPEKVAAAKRAWYEQNKEKVAAAQRAYREQHPEKVAAAKRA
jgi:hypothetical protein